MNRKRKLQREQAERADQTQLFLYKGLYMAEKSTDQPAQYRYFARESQLLEFLQNDHLHWTPFVWSVEKNRYEIDFSMAEKVGL